MIPSIGRNGTAGGLEVDEIPGSLAPLGAAAAVEDDREVTLLQVRDGVAMGVAMEIEPDAGMALQELLEGRASLEVVAGLIVLEEGVVIEEEDRIFGRNERKDLGEVGFEFFGEEALGRVGVGGEAGIEGDGPPAGSDFVRLDGMIFESEKFNRMDDLFPLVRQMAVEVFLSVGTEGVMVVVARNGDPGLLDLLEKAEGLLELFGKGRGGEVTPQKDEVDFELLEEGGKGLQLLLKKVLLTEEKPIQMAKDPL